MIRLTAVEARAVALNAAGIDAQVRDFDQTLEKLGLIQIDSVNVFQRAHLMPAFSRMGAYSLAEFEAWAFGPSNVRRVEEYWAHCAALIPRGDYSLFEFRRDYYRGRDQLTRTLREHSTLAKWILKEIDANGPMAVGQFEHDQNKRKGDWWGWSDVKRVLESLWFVGELVSDGRTNFSRRYALAHKADIAIKTELTEAEQKLRLLEQSALRLGVGTQADIADYYRFSPGEARPLINQLVLEGKLVEVAIEDWDTQAYAHRDGALNPTLNLGARRLRMLSPFDPVVWRRERVKRLFDFEYLIEIYVPEPKRKYGYYTLPLLFDDELVGRVDLKHDRKQKTLEVLSLWHEPGCGKTKLSEMRPHLIRELKLAADWIGAEKVNPPNQGNWTLGRI